MKVQDLRVGNLVFADLYGEKPILVESICSINEDIFNSTTGEIPLSSLKPIPLTEERLLEFGFEIEDDYLELVINERLSIIWVGYLAIMIEGNINFLNTDKVFIHQLQNLFHSLTNKEL